MPGIFPDTSVGGVIVRNADGTSVTPVSGEPPNVYRPAATFTMTCPQTAMPVATCAQPPAAAQMNMLSSQLLALAECWSTVGPYDCTDPTVLCDMFSLWVSTTLPGLVAATFNTCAGADHVAGETIPTCAEMTTAIAAITIPGAVAVAPATTIDAAVPTTRYGDNTAHLGGPVRWVELTIPGVAGLVTIPSYT